MSKSRGASVCGEHRARLIAQIAARIAAGDVGQRQQSDLRVACDLGRLTGGGVAGLARALGLLLGECRLVDEHVRFVGGDVSISHGEVSPEITILRPSRAAAHHLLGATPPTALAALQAPEVRAGLDAEPLGEVGVEVPGRGSSTIA